MAGGEGDGHVVLVLLVAGFRVAQARADEQFGGHFGNQIIPLIFRLRVALSHGPTPPKVRLGQILRDALPGGAGLRQARLRLGVTLLGGAAEPLRGFAQVPRHARAGRIKDPEVVLRGPVRLLRRLPKPLGGLGVVLRLADALRIKDG